jgi:hypothetical protein
MGRVSSAVARGASDLARLAAAAAVLAGYVVGCWALNLRDYCRGLRRSRGPLAGGRPGLGSAPAPG